MNLFQYKKIFILCPSGLRTGGAELLHHLCYVLNENGKKAYIVYTGINEKNYRIINEYKQYISDYLMPSEIKDEADNLIITSETAVYEVKKYNKIIWWLSVDNFFLSTWNNSCLKYRIDKFPKFSARCKNIINYVLRTILGNLGLYKNWIPVTQLNKIGNEYNFCQSQYALDFCRKNKPKNPLFLSDYINDEYSTDINDNLAEKNKKENIVIYNPVKGIQYTKKIMVACSDITFVAIQNMTRDEVKKLMKKAKIYIDFGNFLGKDRMPREACLSGCVVITGKSGAANYYEDLPINNKYKFEIKNKKDVLKVRSRILDIFVNFETTQQEMKLFMENIRFEKENFIPDVNRVFVNKPVEKDSYGYSGGDNRRVVLSNFTFAQSAIQGAA